MSDHAAITPAVHDKNGTVHTTVVLPAYNEAMALPSVLEELARVLDRTYEVIVVDDGSTDGTGEVASRFTVRCVRHEQNLGKGAAVLTGLRHAQGRCVVFCDADWTYPVEAIPQIVSLLETFDIVRCVRTKEREHIPLLNRGGNWIFDRLLRITHGFEGCDSLSGLYGLRCDVMRRMDLQSVGFDVEVEIGIKAAMHGLRTTSFPVAYRSRLGETKLRPWSDGLRILSRIVSLLLLFNPLRCFVAPGLVLMGMAVIAAIALGRGDVVTPYFGLSVHSFIVVTLGILASFQLVVFGVAAAIYGTQYGYHPPRWLVVLNARRIRFAGAAGGLVLALAGLVWVSTLVITWLAVGGGPFERTRELVLASTTLVGGLQVLSAVLFVSLFSGILHKRQHTGVSP